MFNKRKNRTGILQTRRRDVSILDWYFDLDNNKVNFQYYDDPRSFSIDNMQGDYRPTEY